ncbi:hypothetical protein crov229 [Cafeteria roenbergensis virus]|uniref:Uncharacterized protein n=1 Tax=Cafeteria roenbergensis virus (strain BV-PW1) TaxID=693272 RepID=E3T4Z9_CROVB|nr:hypothetical protein crov229 [Cafeteria roenbergensis virus BV-PW1]ADO67262.1 hypothetical protein crov229 [Cafeteria roenbergensis virus BV-PW1]
MIYSELVLKLINTLPNFDCIDDNGNNICHHLASYGDEQIFKSLTKTHTPNWKSILNQRNDEGQTPLHVAVKNNKQKLAKDFIKLGSNQDILDIYGNSCTFKQNGDSVKHINNKDVKIIGKRII